MMTRTLKATCVATIAWLSASMACSAAFAHDGTDLEVANIPPPPAALVQLETARASTARFRDVDQAEHEGYVDIGVFVPNMGWHYLKQSLLDDRFDFANPELLVYADDPCGGKRQLVAVEYAVPLAESRNAPSGFIGRADTWEVNAEFGLWTLHAWIWEYNTAGVFAPLNPFVASP
jgi:hypothetical protein